MSRQAGHAFSFSQTKKKDMQNKLFIRRGKVVTDGRPGDAEVTYNGARPQNVIRLITSAGTFYFADEREAFARMQKSDIDEVSLLPVET